MVANLRQSFIMRNKKVAYDNNVFAQRIERFV